MTGVQTCALPIFEKAKEKLGWEAKMKADDSIRLCLKYIVEGGVHA